MNEEKEEVIEVTLRELEETVGILVRQCMADRVSEVYRGNTNGYFQVLGQDAGPEVSIKVQRKSNGTGVSVLVNRQEISTDEFPVEYRFILETGAKTLLKLVEKSSEEKAHSVRVAYSILNNQFWAETREHTPGLTQE